MCRSLPMARTTTSPELRPTRILTTAAVSAPHLFRVLLHAFLHPERRVASAHGVILVGQRRAEEGHDPVAHDLVHGALVAVDSFHHPLEDRIEQLPRLLGIAVGEQLHRALEISEEHGHLLPFAFERALGGQDSLGEVLGGIGPGRGERIRRCAERSGALAAELVLGGIGCATGGADRHESTAHSPQNFMPGGLSCWHRGHRISSLRLASGEGVKGCRELSSGRVADQGQGGIGALVPARDPRVMARSLWSLALPPHAGRERRRSCGDVSPTAFFLQHANLAASCSSRSLLAGVDLIGALDLLTVTNTVLSHHGAGTRIRAGGRCRRARRRHDVAGPSARRRASVCERHGRDRHADCGRLR